MKHVITLELKDSDHDAIQRAVGVMQSGQAEAAGEPVGPDGESNLVGMVVSQICRGWLEFCGVGTSDLP